MIALVRYVKHSARELCSAAEMATAFHAELYEILKLMHALLASFSACSYQLQGSGYALLVSSTELE